MGRGGGAGGSITHQACRVCPDCSRSSELHRSRRGGGGQGSGTVPLYSVCSFLWEDSSQRPNTGFQWGHRLARFWWCYLFSVKTLIWLDQHCFLLCHECIFWDKLEFAWSRFYIHFTRINATQGIFVLATHFSLLCLCLSSRGHWEFLLQMRLTKPIVDQVPRPCRYLYILNIISSILAQE